MTYYNCPVCGYDQLTKPPKDYRICPCCGTEFESDDFDRTYRELRSKWIDRGMAWFSRSTTKPKDWNPYRQLIIAEFGSDLVGHSRFRADLDYRYALNKAFSEVRMGKQLKVLRESRREPFTQSQLADRVEPVMKQSRISELETMNYSSWSISTIERLARALGVGVKYSFAGWGELVPEIAGGLSREELWIPSFEDDPAFRDRDVPERSEAIFAKLAPTPTRTSTVVSIADYYQKRQPPAQETSVVDVESPLTLEKAAVGSAR